MMTRWETLLDAVASFFFIYLMIYATYLFFSVALGAVRLYQKDRMLRIKNELKHKYYVPVSILVPAYNEEVTILDSIKSLFSLDYRLYEIVVIDDGSADNTTGVLVEALAMKEVSRPIHRMIPCQEVEKIYETRHNNIDVTLIRKKNGGKGDALNMGINASRYPYFICMDADSMLQNDSLERIVQPVMEDENVVAVGGLIRVAQCIELVDGKVKGYHLPRNFIIGIQAMEYDRSFLASRILLDEFNGNLIISGAFGLFKKDIVIAVGGYDAKTLGEDMELVVKMHAFCRSNNIKYSIRYEPNAICWSQVPGSLSDLAKQRRRWHLGLFQSLEKYKGIFLNRNFGLIGYISYTYYLLYELFSPVIEIFGIVVTAAAALHGYLNIPFMIGFYLLYSFYGIILTITAFFQRIYTQKLHISKMDALRAIIVCFIETVFFHPFFLWVRAMAFVGYHKHKLQWGNIKREKQSSIN